MADVRFRPIARDDLALIARWRNDPALKQHFRAWRDFSMGDQERFYDWLIGNETFLYWVVEAVEGFTARPIGVAGLTYIDWLNRHAELSLYIGNPDFRGCGYGVALLNELHRRAFDELGLHRMELECWSTNPAWRIYEKYGYTQIGRWRERHFIGGKFVDTILADITADEWRAKCQTN